MLRCAIAILMFLAPLLAQATEPSLCTGKNLLDEIGRSNPKLHAEIMAEADTTPNGNAIFWRIEGKDGVADSWLYGTAHLTDPRLTKLAPGAAEAIAEARVVALELKEIADRQTLMAAMMRRARFLALPLGESLWSLIGDREEAEIKASPNFPAERAAVIEAYRPWVVATILSLPQCERLRQAAGLSGVDESIGRMAQGNNIEIVGLETVDEQLAVFADMPVELQVKYLVATARSGAIIADYVETLVQLYERRKITALMPLSKRTEVTDKAGLEVMVFIERDLIAKRNRLMHDRALALIEEGNAFIAVGALHLPGKDGLVELFRQAGYKVTPVN